MIRLWINVETVAIMRPESRGECELYVPGVREHYDDMGQGQVQLLLAYGDRVTGPDDVTAATPEMNRLGG